MSAVVCCRCERLTLAPVAVRYVERASGPGWTLYACPDCAPLLASGPLPTETAPLPQCVALFGGQPVGEGALDGVHGAGGVGLGEVCGGHAARLGVVGGEVGRQFGAQRVQGVDDGFAARMRALAAETGLTDGRITIPQPRLR